MGVLTSFVFQESLIFEKDLFILFYVSECFACRYVCSMCVPVALGSQKASDPVELELQLLAIM